jgi:ABC-type nitrate/sulfonate/bicarbonate transport system substrate-binding protein
MAVDITVGLIAKALPCAPLWVAQRAGFFDELDLRVTQQILGSGDAVTEGIRAGDVQIGLTTPEGAIGDQLDGGSIRIISGLDNQLPFKLIGSRGHDDIESLRGGRIGVSSMKEGTVHVLKTMLARHGLTYPDDYRLDVVGTHVDRWALLQTGEIDAGLQITPYDVIAEQAGYPDLGAPSAYIPEFAFIVASADTRWCAKNRKAVVDFLTGIRRGADVVFDDSARAAGYVAEETGLEVDLVRTALEDLTAKSMLPRDLRATEGALAAVIDSMRAAGEDVPGSDPQTFVDDEYRAAVFA